MKKSVLWIAALSMALLCGVSCKSKQSSYKSAYEQAKERQITDAPLQEDEIIPVTKSKETTSTVTRQERITPVAGENASGIKLYSVVIGSFSNKTNAYALKEEMQNNGYMPVLAENETGMLRVILTSHESRQDAELSKEEVRRKYSPRFSDAWILERRY